MRTLRLFLVGTVILTLLGGLGGAVLAQDEEDAPAWVKLLTRGDLRIEGMAGSALPGVGFRESIRDLQGAWDNTYSDARLDGTQHLVHNEDCAADGICVAWGTVDIEGPDGTTTWTGWYHEIDDDDTDGVDDASWHFVLTGTGPNEGLTAILFSLGVWEQFPNEYGVIYRGDPPPGPEVLLAAE